MSGATTEPVPPQGVRVVTGTGREVPLETRYDGVDDDGRHVWTALFPVGVARRDALEALELRVDMLPPRTRVALELTLGGER